MPPKKAKKKPPKPSATSSSSNDKKPTVPSAAAKKKELADGKKTEIKQLQDSLSSFFTPTSSRRSRHPPIEIKTIPESSIERSHSSGDNNNESSPEPLSPKPGSSKEPPPQKLSSSPKPGPSRVKPKTSPPRDDPEPGTTIITYRTGGSGPPTVIVRKGKSTAPKSSSSPEPCSSKTTAKELAAKKSKKAQLRKPGNLPRGYKSGKASSSEDEDGYPNQAGPIELIESIKSMEEINRLNPDFKEFEVDSDTEYEEEPAPDPSEFDTWNEYLAEKCNGKRKMKKVIDGMTRAQRREHRQFALEFKELLDALKDNHMAYCDGPFKKFSKPFDPPEGFKGRTSEQILQQATTRMEAALKKSASNVHKKSIPDPTIKREPNSDDSPPSSPSSSSSEDSDDDKSDDEFVDFRQRFSEMDLKPLINMRGMEWRDLLPPKPPKEGEDEASSESSATTDSDDDPKPLQWEVAGAIPQIRPPEWERYRSTIERVIYRRYIRRACRTIVKSNKRKSKIHKFLQIGTFAPDRPIPDPPTRIPPAIVDDDECAEIPNYMSMHDMINEATPEHKSLLIKHFNDENRRDVRRIKEYEKAAADGPVPKFIYISKYQMKTSYTSPLPFHLRVKDELFLCDQCLDGWIDRDPYERHTVSFVKEDKKIMQIFS
uniref:MYST zinc finger domain-containing protein n=1 Tax=Panagrolaimus davidi TaxID=227884 RepID=A0A914QNK0_9BILA